MKRLIDSETTVLPKVSSQLILKCESLGQFVAENVLSLVNISSATATVRQLLSMIVQSFMGSMLLLVQKLVSSNAKLMCFFHSTLIAQSSRVMAAGLDFGATWSI